MFAELRLRTGTNWVNSTVIQTFKDLSFDSKYQDVGAFNVSIPLADAISLSIGDQSVIEVRPNGGTAKNMLFGIQGTGTTKIIDGAKWKTFSGSSIIQWLTDGIVYPSSWPSVPTVNPDGTTTPVIQGHAFEDATPGTILRTFTDRAQTRGALLWLDDSTFTGTTDSNGSAWTTTLSTTYANGTTILQVVQDLAQRRLIQFRMDGLTLQVYNYDEMVSHKTQDQVFFRAGRDILEQNTSTDSSSAGSALLMEGDQTFVVEVTDSGLQTAIGRRREKYVSQGGITDIPTLTFLATAELGVSGHILNEETIGVKDSGLTPWTDYDVGDWVWEDTDGTASNQQIQQISGAGTDANNLTIGLTLGDIIDANDILLQRKIDNITGADAGVRGALPNTINDHVAPSPPSGLNLSPNAYRDANGIDLCQITISWAAPTTNIDTSPLIDLDRYEVQYKVAGSSAWTAASNVPGGGGTTAYVSNLPTGKTFQAQVRAVDTDGNASTWLVSSTITLPTFTSAPKAPANPTVQAFFQTLLVSWSGVAFDTSAYGTEFDHVEVHVGTTSTFTPSSSTLKTSIRARPGSAAVNGLAYATNFWVKLIAVDKSGNSSSASGSVGPTQVSQIAGGDIPDNSITTTMIQDNSISTPKLQANSVTAANIAANSITASMIQTGALDAMIINAGALTAGTVSAGSIGSSLLNQCDLSACDIVVDPDGGTILIYALASQIVTTFTTAGNTTWTAPAGVTSVKAECIGGGGAGGGSAANGFGGAGGGGGEYACEPSYTVVPATVYNLTVGSGGVGNGGNTSTLATATIFDTANNGVVAHPGASQTAGSGFNYSGGSGSTNAIHFNGGTGHSAGGTFGTLGGGGGGSGGKARAGNPGGAGSGSTGGAGGSGVPGGGGGGAGGNAGGAGNAGTSGASPGGGGGGAGGGTSAHNGGSGATGKITLTYGGVRTLVCSIAGAAGTDAYGNTYPAGVRTNRAMTAGVSGGYYQDGTFTNTTCANLVTNATVLNVSGGNTYSDYSNPFSGGAIWTCPADGIYAFTSINAFAAFSAAATRVGHSLRNNVTGVYLARMESPASAGTNWSATLSKTLFVTQGTQLIWDMFQNSGATQNISTVVQPSWSIFRVG